MASLRSQMQRVERICDDVSRDVCADVTSLQRCWGTRAVDSQSLTNKASQVEGPTASAKKERSVKGDGIRGGESARMPRLTLVSSLIQH